MVRDITAIKRVETSLRASHAALRKIFDATLDIIVVTRLSDGAYIDFNQQFERLGYGQKDLDDSRKGPASDLGERGTTPGVSRPHYGRRRGAQHGGRFHASRRSPDAGVGGGGAGRTRRRRLRGHDDSRPDRGQASVTRAGGERSRPARDLRPQPGRDFGRRRVRRQICGSQRGISTTGRSHPRRNDRQVGPRTRRVGQAVGPRKIQRDPRQPGSGTQPRGRFSSPRPNYRPDADFRRVDRLSASALRRRLHSRHHAPKADRARPAVGARGIVAAGQSAQRQRRDLPQALRRQSRQHDAHRHRRKLHRCEPGIHQGDGVLARRSHRPSFRRSQHVDSSGRNDCLRRSTLENQRSPQPRSYCSA